MAAFDSVGIPKKKKKDEGFTVLICTCPLFSQTSTKTRKKKKNDTNISDANICSASPLHDADNVELCTKENSKKNKMLTRRQTVDGGTQKSWGKVGEKEKKKKTGHVYREGLK